MEEQPFIEQELKESLVPQNQVVQKGHIEVNQIIPVKETEPPVLDSDLYSLTNVVKSGNLNLLKPAPSVFTEDPSIINEKLNILESKLTENG